MRLITRRSLCWVAASAAALAGAVAHDDAPAHAFDALWRKPGRDGLSCVSCHSDSGREIWMSAITPDNVRRRALRHLNGEDASRLALLTEEMRRGTTPVGIPFAPADCLLPGNTPAARDRAFVLRLRRDGFPLLTETIQTLADAQRVDVQIRSVPLDRVPVGIQLDPVSRDPAHGGLGPMLGDWIPDVPAKEPVSTPLAELARRKRIALRFYEERLKGSQVRIAPDSVEHPLWSVGSFARFYGDATGRTFGLSEGEARDLGVSLDRPLGFNEVALSWFWIAWTLDPSLQTLSRDPQARNGAYMSEMLWKGGPYPFHAAYFAARRPLELRAKQPGFALQPDFAAFVNNDNLLHYQPAKPEARLDFIAACRALLRMDCLLLTADLTHGRDSANPVGAIQQIGALWHYVKGQDTPGENAQTQPIVDAALNALKAPAQRQIKG